MDMTPKERGEYRAELRGMSNSALLKVTMDKALSGIDTTDKDLASMHNLRVKELKFRLTYLERLRRKHNKGVK